MATIANAEQKMTMRVMRDGGEVMRYPPHSRNTGTQPRKTHRIIRTTPEAAIGSPSKRIEPVAAEYIRNSGAGQVRIRMRAAVERGKRNRPSVGNVWPD